METGGTQPGKSEGGRLEKSGVLGRGKGWCGTVCGAVSHSERLQQRSEGGVIGSH